jgi:hypothetical protein
MNCELLLEWMTHMGSGSWGAFRDALDAVTSAKEQLDEDVYRGVRIALSDLCHADFFIGSSRRWCVRRPALATLVDRTKHLFIGGRTRVLTDKLARATLGVDAITTMTESIPGLSRVLVEGDADALRSVATGLGVQFVPRAAAQIAAGLLPIRQMFEAAAKVAEPVNWTCTHGPLTTSSGFRTGWTTRFENTETATGLGDTSLAPADLSFEKSSSARLSTALLS